MAWDKQTNCCGTSSSRPISNCWRTAGSPVLEVLRALENKGVTLTICSTCLNHYGLADQVAVGIAGGMTDIIEAQWRANKVITL